MPEHYTRGGTIAALTTDRYELPFYRHLPHEGPGTREEFWYRSVSEETNVEVQVTPAPTRTSDRVSGIRIHAAARPSLSWSAGHEVSVTDLTVRDMDFPPSQQDMARYLELQHAAGEHALRGLELIIPQ